MSEDVQESRPLALTPTWSVATVLTFFVAVSLLVERSIHYLTNWLRKTNQKPLLAALEKMKEEMMLLGFISLLLTATSSTISNICIPSKYYHKSYSPCTRSEIDDEMVTNGSKERKLCNKGYRPIVSYEALEQLHRFIFLMAVTHISYSCLTMLLAILKIQSWRVWENEAHIERHNSLADIMGYRSKISLESVRRRQSTDTSSSLVGNGFLIWVTCFFRQLGNSVVRDDYLTLRKGFIMNHSLTLKYDFHSYMIRSMEEEFQKIVGVSGPLWGFIVVFMLFNIKPGSILYFLVAIIPISLILLVGTKLQHVITTLALENAKNDNMLLQPRDELFWFKKPELLLSLIHFILFQNSFELASFIWLWWQLGYNSCFIKNHILVHLRLIFGFVGQFLCSYSTLPLYAIVTQMGTKYKAALIPRNIRETIDEWGKASRRRKKNRDTKDDIELQSITASRAAGTPLLRHSASVSSSSSVSMPRSYSVRSRK